MSRAKNKCFMTFRVIGVPEQLKLSLDRESAPNLLGSAKGQCDGTCCQCLHMTIGKKIVTRPLWAVGRVPICTMIGRWSGRIRREWSGANDGRIISPNALVTQIGQFREKHLRGRVIDLKISEPQFRIGPGSNCHVDTITSVGPHRTRSYQRSGSQRAMHYRHGIADGILRDIRDKIRRELGDPASASIEPIARKTLLVLIPIEGEG